MPKTPEQLKAEIEAANKDRPDDDSSRTAEGLKVPNPSRDDFFGNLARVSERESSDGD